MEKGMLLILSSSILLRFAHTEREFVFVNTYLDWTSAQTHCREKFTDMVTVYNEQENQKLMALTENNNVNIWIGLRQKLDHWRMSMGVPPLSIYNNDAIWAEGQPDNRDGGQHCAEVSIAHGEGIFDRECTLLFSFICFDGSATENYLFIHDAKTWHGAQEYCRTNHADLASVSTVTERQNFLGMLKARGAKDAWIGLYRDPWITWSDNSNTTFYNWEAEPTIYLTDDHCAYLSTATGKWQENYCSTSYPFFCYRDGQRQATQRQTILKIKLQSGGDLSNIEIQQQIIEQMKNRLGPGEANLTVKWRATTKTNPVSLL